MPRLIKVSPDFRCLMYGDTPVKKVNTKVYRLRSFHLEYLSVQPSEILAGLKDCDAMRVVMVII